MNMEDRDRLGFSLGGERISADFIAGERAIAHGGDEETAIYFPPRPGVPVGRRIESQRGELIASAQQTWITTRWGEWSVTTERTRVSWQLAARAGVDPTPMAWVRPAIVGYRVATESVRLGIHRALSGSGWKLTRNGRTLVGIGQRGNRWNLDVRPSATVDRDFGLVVCLSLITIELDAVMPMPAPAGG